MSATNNPKVGPEVNNIPSAQPVSPSIPPSLELSTSSFTHSIAKDRYDGETVGAAFLIADLMSARLGSENDSAELTEVRKILEILARKAAADDGDFQHLVAGHSEAHLVAPITEIPEPPRTNFNDATAALINGFSDGFRQHAPELKRLHESSDPLTRQQQEMVLTIEKIAGELKEFGKHAKQIPGLAELMEVVERVATFVSDLVGRIEAADKAERERQEEAKRALARLAARGNPPADFASYSDSPVVASSGMEDRRPSLHALDDGPPRMRSDSGALSTGQSSSPERERAAHRAAEIRGSVLALTGKESPETLASIRAALLGELNLASGSPELAAVASELNGELRIVELQLASKGVPSRMDNYFTAA